MRSIEKNLAAFNEAGVRPVAISVDSPEDNRWLAQQASYTFPILSDSNFEAIRRFDIVHAGAGENGKDIARPAEFLIDSAGVVRWLNLTENYMVRVPVEEMLAASRDLK